MKLTAKGEYACLALLDLAERFNKGMIKTEDIAKRRKIPKKYLEQILLLLNKAGYIRSKRGVDGGYALLKNPKDISLAEIIRLIDGPLAPVESASKYFYSCTPLEQSREFMKLMKDIRDYTAKKLETSSFADLLN
jgi:Rrf2 family transcriptional regulator, cysteine metabolism repressor